MVYVKVYAREAATDAESRKDRIALTVLAQDCASGTGKTLKAFDELLTAANRWQLPPQSTYAVKLTQRREKPVEFYGLSGTRKNKK